MPPGAQEAIESAAATNHWSNVITTVLMLGMLTIFGALVRYYTTAATKKQELSNAANLEQNKLTAKIAADSIEASAKRELTMVETMKASEEYIRSSLRDMWKETNKTANMATSALNAFTESNKVTAAAVQHLVRVTEEQTRVIRRGEELLSDSQIGRINKPDNHGGSVHG